LNENCIFHVSFDVDGLDPESMSSTGTTAVNGLTPNDVIECVNYVKDRLIAFDIVEYNPMLGDNEESIQTIRNIIENINSLSENIWFNNFI